MADQEWHQWHSGPRQPRPAYGAPQPQYDRPRIQDDTLKETEVQVERKLFLLSLRDNTRGRILRITEDGGGRRNSIIIPSTGLKEFLQVLKEMVKASDQLPPKLSPSDQPPA